jgi:predicted Fe-Mo cluster-binding NifX family protein
VGEARGDNEQERKEKMRIAIPLHQGAFSEHFGGAETFAFYTVDDERRDIGERTLEHSPEHNRGVFPLWLRNQGATHVLAGGMGPRAVDLLVHHGIEVVLGVTGDDPDAVVRAYLEGTLEATGEACNDHGFHGCGQDHGEHSHEHGRGGCRQA